MYGFTCRFAESFYYLQYYKKGFGLNSLNEKIIKHNLTQQLIKQNKVLYLNGSTDEEKLYDRKLQRETILGIGLHHKLV